MNRLNFDTSSVRQRQYYNDNIYRNAYTTAPDTNLDGIKLQQLNQDTVKFSTTNYDEFDYSIDDGKISFGDKIKNFAKGLISPITTMFSSPKEPKTKTIPSLAASIIFVKKLLNASKISLLLGNKKIAVAKINSKKSATVTVLILTAFLLLLKSQAIKRKINIPAKPIIFCNILIPYILSIKFILLFVYR